MCILQLFAQVSSHHTHHSGTLTPGAVWVTLKVGAVAVWTQKLLTRPCRSGARTAMLLIQQVRGHTIAFSVLRLVLIIRTLVCGTLLNTDGLCLAVVGSKQLFSDVHAGMCSPGVPCTSEVRSFALTCYVQDMLSGMATSCPTRAWQPVRLKSGPAALQAGHCRGPALWPRRAGEETIIRKILTLHCHVTSTYSRLSSLSPAMLRSPAFQNLYRVASCSYF